MISRYHSGLTALEKVLAEAGRYEHPLFEIPAREQNGSIELVIRSKDRARAIHIYYAPLHAQDIDHPQFPWTFQRYLYDCLHDYVVEMFLRTPQTQEP
ncbi:MAG TPA: hypothetical protein VG096_04445 [Bryobacteraceae bacterium]|nr:hypothetical protein [Bryobacteraceae bacterium]